MIRPRIRLEWSQDWLWQTMLRWWSHIRVIQFVDFYSNYFILKIEIIFLHISSKISFSKHLYHLSLGINGPYKTLNSLDFENIIYKQCVKFAKYSVNVSCYFKCQSLLVVVITHHILIIYSATSEKIMMAFNMM